MPTLAANARARLPDSAFAYVDAKGRRRLLRAAKKYRIVPIGFFDGQLRKERLQTAIRARAKDIEGSTGLLRQLGDGYATVLREVRTLIRKGVRDAGGPEVDARADEFFAVFRHGARALDAAVQIQRSLRKREWPFGAEVCVRTGIHTGRTTLTETGYVGIAVNTAARICSAGHGGQILASSASRDALEGSEAGGISFVSLGRYALAGLPDPETLFQVRAAELRVKFPRLRTTAVTTRRAAPRSR